MIKSMNQFLWLLEKVHRNKICCQYLKNGEVESVSFKEFVADIKNEYKTIRNEIGDFSNCHIAIRIPYSYEYIIKLYAIMYGGGVAVPLNIFESEDTLNYEIELVDADYVICIDGIQKCNPKTAVENRKLPDKKELRPIAMLLSSGTTGKNKAVVMNMKTLQYPMFSYAKKTFGSLIKASKNKLNFKQGFSLYQMMPMYHIGGFEVVTCFFLAGQTVNFCFDYKYQFKDLKKMNSRCCLTVPIVLKAWAKQLEKGKNIIGDIEFIACGAAALDQRTVDIFAKNNIYIIQAYGMTEFGISNFNFSFEMEKMSSVGDECGAFPVELRGNEIWIKPSDGFLGYYNMPKETKDLFVDGWIDTGDLGYKDEEGYLYITGRKKNTIILASGENVSPEELEHLIEESSFVDDVIVKNENEQITAVIYSHTNNETEIRNFIDEINVKLPHYKRVTNIRFVDCPMEKTALGKIKRGM